MRSINGVTFADSPLHRTCAPTRGAPTLFPVEGVRPVCRDRSCAAANHLPDPSFLEVQEAAPGAPYRNDVSARPPSMETVAPVIQEAASEARNRTRDATSSGLPTRPRGCVAAPRSTKAA